MILRGNSEFSKGEKDGYTATIQRMNSGGFILNVMNEDGKVIHRETISPVELLRRKAVEKIQQDQAINAAIDAGYKIVPNGKHDEDIPF